MSFDRYKAPVYHISNQLFLKNWVFKALFLCHFSHMATKTTISYFKIIKLIIMGCPAPGKVRRIKQKTIFFYPACVLFEAETQIC
jgi:hypothetical protein